MTKPGASSKKLHWVVGTPGSGVMCMASPPSPPPPLTAWDLGSTQETLHGRHTMRNAPCTTGSVARWFCAGLVGWR